MDLEFCVSAMYEQLKNKYFISLLRMVFYQKKIGKDTVHNPLIETREYIPKMGIEEINV